MTRNRASAKKAGSRFETLVATYLAVHKRHGRGDPADQWVTCTLGDLVALLTGHREGTR